MVKYCSTCKETKDIFDFWKNKARSDGHHHQCKTCMKISYKPKTKEQACRDVKNYALRHPERVKERWGKWYAKNKEVRLVKKYIKDKLPEQIEKRRKWVADNRDRINALRRVRKKNMPVKEKLSKALRDRFYKVIVRMKTGKKIISSFDLLGCTIDYFKTYIENQFCEGMEWGNHGNGDGKWNIDHIVPLVKFDLFNLQEQKKAFHYTNMRPLWFLENMRRPRKAA